MARVLIISSCKSAGITQTVVDFAHVTYAEDAIKKIEEFYLKELRLLGPIDMVRVQAIRLYDPEKGRAEED